MTELTVEQRLELLEMERDAFHAHLRCWECSSCNHRTMQMLVNNKHKYFECLTCGGILTKEGKFNDSKVVRWIEVEGLTSQTFND